MGSMAVVFFIWGDEYIQEAENCIHNSPALEGYDLLLLTDHKTELKGRDSLFSQIIRADFQSGGLIRKSELIDHLPSDYEVYLLLDSDTLVLEDIRFGFEKARKHGIAMAPCHHYALDHFWNFNEVMQQEKHPLSGQLQYNTGVIFFSLTPEVKQVMEMWRDLSLTHRHIINNDQPFFTLALEKLGFNPYTLPITYNYRGSGDPISGKVRIWHSHLKMPGNINDRTTQWPLRRAYPSTTVYFDLNRFWYWPKRLIQKIKKALGMVSL